MFDYKKKHLDGGNLTILDIDKVQNSIKFEND